MKLQEPCSPEDWKWVRILIQEYARDLGFDLCFQNFDQELKDLEKMYAAPKGAFFLAQEKERILGCVGLRELDKISCEMKRLYVRPEGRGRGLGKTLVEEVLRRAAQLGYSRVLLDTVGTMKEAQNLYHKLGFREIAPYRENPIAGARYFAKELE